MVEYPPVSVFITTCLNTPERGKVLLATCRNALAQNYPEFEVVVSDNAGDYPAEEALAELKDPRLRVFRNDHNIGQAGNSNLCLERCVHDIIKVNCDDDLLHPDCLRATVPYVDDDTYVIAGKEKYIIGEHPAELDQPLPDSLEVTCRAPGYRKDIWDYTHVCLPGCCLFTRNLFIELGGYNEKPVFFDYDFLLEARMRKQVVTVKHPLCMMGVWKGSFSNRAAERSPYFFSIGSLYTKFRLLRSTSLTPADKRGLRFKLIRWFLKESLRVPRHLFSGRYWRGYFEFVDHMIRYVVHPSAAREVRNDGIALGKGVKKGTES